MKKFPFFRREPPQSELPIQTAPARPFLSTPMPLMGGEERLFASLRDAVPLIDAAMTKLVRLVGGFTVEASDKALQKKLDAFLNTVPVSGGGVSVNGFIERLLDCMLTCGSAVGEIVLSRDKRAVAGLYNASPEEVEVVFDRDPFVPTVLVRDRAGTAVAPTFPSLIVYTALPPLPGQERGRSLLAGMPFYASVLSTIFQSVGQNFERMGNLRYAVTYRPPQGFAPVDDNVAAAIAKEWTDGMNTRGGVVKDFVAVGDVDIRVIGADGQMPEVAVPVKCILEQLIAKLGIPPFMLGLSWSTTERMSAQQADMLTSELDAFRRYLTPVILKVVRVWAALGGHAGDFTVRWQDINLQDEVELARAELLRAQAAQLQGGMTH